MAERDYPDLIWRAQSVELVDNIGESARSAHPTMTVPVDAVGGTHLAESVSAPADMPPADIATMDGFAVDANDAPPYVVRDAMTAAEDDPSDLEQGEAVRIATGASLPERANAVIKREETTIEDGRLHAPSVPPGTYTYERGSNVRAGETLFEAGERLRAVDAILLKDLGRESVSIRAPYAAGILATGNEIVENPQADLDSAMLAGLIRRWGHEATIEGAVTDEPERVTERIAELATQYDVVVTTGGTSVGKHDYVIEALSELGEVQFHRVRIRPGKPIAMATLPDATVFAIPGKPVGAYVVATLVMRPFFTGNAAVTTRRATMAHDFELGPEGFEYVVPVALEDGRATAFGHPSSPLAIDPERFDPSVLSSSTRATRADGVVIRTDPLEAGEQVDVIPVPALET